MNKGQGNEDNGSDSEEDCKPTVQEKRQAEEVQVASDSDNSK